MHLSHLLIHASYREGFPNTLLQAGAMGCPIICSSIEGNIDVVTNAETGLLFRPKDEVDLLEKLKCALSHTDEMKKYAINLRSKIEKYFKFKFNPSLYLYKKYSKIL